MLVLCIDTSGADCAVLLARDGATVAQARERLGRGHAERLAPMTRDMLAQAGAAPAALDRIGVVTGPGSFAGIRVGVAFARGLALTLDIPALGVSLFDLMARAHADASALAAAHDAARGEIAFRLYRSGAAQGGVQRLPVADAAKEIAKLGAAPLIAGSGAALLAPLVPGAHTAPDGAADLALMARLVTEGDPADGPPNPLYVRPPDAKLPGGLTPGDAA
jgi:tRNA threonylcarbamoyladenosine biosynthesis protein TsaB